MDKNKEATINLINKKDNKCFQHTVTVTLSHEEIKRNSPRITKTKSFINKYNWEGINFSSEKDDREKKEKNEVTIALIVWYSKKEKIYPAYVSKHNSNREKQVIILRISNGDKRERSETLATRAKSEGQCHYLAVKKLLALSRGITFKKNW